VRSYMSPHYIGPTEIVEKKKRYVIPCVYHFYKDPPQMVRGEMEYLYDHQGKRYLDFYAGVSVVNAGHCHPEITDRICEQVKTLQHTTTIYLTQPMVELAERLASITPGNLSSTFFCNSGSEANEGALLLAKLSTGREGVVALENSLHGRTYMTMSITGIPMWRTDSALSHRVAFVPRPYCYRCSLNLSYPGCDLQCAYEIKKALQKERSYKMAAFIAEPIQGNGGIIVPPPDYFKVVKEILDQHGMLFICDEVQTGFGRTGTMFAIEQWDVVPSILTVAKALANGVPVGAFTATPEIASSYTKPGASTLGGNPVTAVAALATLDVHQKYNLRENALDLGDYFKERLLELQEKHPLIGEVRGKGLMLGAELIRDNKIPATEATDTILEYLKDHGILIGKTGTGRNVLTFQPPLIITKDEINQVIAALDDALDQPEIKSV
jgi:4-aminobutyrate aminotransferase/(S)-3-amino-2-methylpropionate transaminase